MKLLKGRNSISFFFVSILLGCVSLPNYNIVIKNTGTKAIDDAYVSYDAFHSVGGFLSPGANAGHLDPGYPVPEKAIVEWRAENGQLYKKEVEVKKYIPRNFQGDIQFEINDSNEVTVRAIRDVY